MEITELATGCKRKVIISTVEEDDFKVLVKKQYSFDWKSFKGKLAIFKLCLEDEPDKILGVVGIVDVPDEMRIEIKLIANSKENVGKKKHYEGIAGYLIAFVGKMASDKYKRYACVSLIPKTELIAHYTNKFHMVYAGWQLYLEGDLLRRLLKEYDL
ncbi:MAG: hypothetical protein J7621_09410 [Niastella sp.]|nr:hypothetical protein [Niastella sp.]